jgi:hypothetical protein
VPAPHRAFAQVNFGFKTFAPLDPGEKAQVDAGVRCQLDPGENAQIDPGAKAA